MNILTRHWLPLIGLNAAIVAATYFAAKSYAENFSPVWKASAQLNLPTQSVNLDADLGSLGNLRDSGVGFSREVNPLNLQVAILRSNILFERLIETDPEKESYPTLNSYRSLFTISPSEQSTTISIEVEASSLELAQQRVATLIDLYQQRLTELRRENVDARKQYTQDELNQALEQLLEAQNALAVFKDEQGIADVDRQISELIEAINGLRTTRTNILAEKQAVQTRAHLVARDLGMSPEQALASLRLAENLEYQAVRETLTAVETELAEARSSYTDQHPNVQSLLARRDEIRRELERRLRAVVPDAAGIDTTLGSSDDDDSRIGAIVSMLEARTTAEGLERQADALARQIASLEQELKGITRDGDRLLDLQREYEIAEGVYRGAIAQVQQSQTNPFNAYPNVQTLEAPVVDSEPSEPRLKLVALGGILASIFGSTALVLALENRKPLLRPQDLQQVELPAVIRISRLKQAELRRSLQAEPSVEFQRLASIVSSMMLENRRLMVTSSMLGEGKTTITLGLAIALVGFGFRVLLVDGDLRRAELSRRLKTQSQNQSSTSEEELVEIRPGLDFVRAPEVPSDKIAEFCARGRFARALDRHQNNGDYDYVLVDSAPTSLAIESTLMSVFLQNVLFVVRHGSSDRYSVIDSIEQLRQQGARIAGVAVNGVESRSEGYRYTRQIELLNAES